MNTDSTCDMKNVLERVALAVRSSQEQLDTLGRQTMEKWDETGFPPYFTLWKELNLNILADLDVCPSESCHEVKMRIVPGKKGASEITVNLGFLPCLPEENKTKD